MLRAVFAAIACISLVPQYSCAKEVTINPGETLSEIAERYKVPIEKLKLMNGINNPNELQAGEILILPDNAYFKSTSKKNVHTVVNGETLSEIALKNQINQQDLININNLKSADNIYIGQRLRLTYDHNSTKMIDNLHHKVVNGDTLNSIAMKYGKSQQEIRAINNLKDANHLYIGQEINLSKVNPEIKEKITLSAKVIKEKSDYHIVSAGQTLSSIAKERNILLKDLIHINDLSDPNNLEIGSKLALGKSNKEASANLNTQPDSLGKAQWRNYGPLQIDWSNWEPMDGSHVAPTLHKNGNSLYVAVNCSFRKLNATGSNGAWRNWISPENSFEHKLINDLCKAKDS